MHLDVGVHGAGAEDVAIAMEVEAGDGCLVSTDGPNSCTSGDMAGKEKHTSVARGKKSQRVGRTEALMYEMQVNTFLNLQWDPANEIVEQKQKVFNRIVTDSCSHRGQRL